MTDTWRAISLTANGLRLDVLPGVGGRLWDIVYNGQSLLFKNPDLIARRIDPGQLAGLPTRSPQFGFPLWGGEKTWIAPDTAWQDGAPSPTLDAAPFAIVARDARRIHVRSAPCQQSGLQIDRWLRLGGGNSFSIHHKVTNHGTRPRFTGIWSVMMMNTPARIGLSIGPEEEIVPVFGEAGSRVTTQDTLAVFDCADPHEFKLGTNNPTGRTLICCAGGIAPVWMICETAPIAPGERFAHGHNFEVFNSGDYAYCEAEWHSPAEDLAPGGTMAFTQAFTVLSDREMRSQATLIEQDQELMTCMSS